MDILVATTSGSGVGPPPLTPPRASGFRIRSHDGLHFRIDDLGNGWGPSSVRFEFCEERVTLQNLDDGRVTFAGNLATDGPFEGGEHPIRSVKEISSKVFEGCSSPALNI